MIPGAPVPAEHLSFMTNFLTAPPASAMILVSWPPTCPPPHPSRPNRRARRRGRGRRISVTTFTPRRAGNPAVAGGHDRAPVRVDARPRPRESARSRAASTLLNLVGTGTRASAPSSSSTATFVAVDPTSMPTYAWPSFPGTVSDAPKTGALRGLPVGGVSKSQSASALPGNCSVGQGLCPCRNLRGDPARRQGQSPCPTSDLPEAARWSFLIRPRTGIRRGRVPQQ